MPPSVKNSLCHLPAQPRRKFEKNEGRLQEEKKKTLINADADRKAIFGGKKQVTMFEMTKHVSGHLK